MRLLFSFLIVPILLAAIRAQTKAIDFVELEKTIEAELKANKTPGAAVAIIVGDKVVYAKGFGATNAENGNPINADTFCQRRKIISERRRKEFCIDENRER